MWSIRAPDKMARKQHNNTQNSTKTHTTAQKLTEQHKNTQNNNTPQTFRLTYFCVVFFFFLNYFYLELLKWFIQDLFHKTHQRHPVEVFLNMFTYCLLIQFEKWNYSCISQTVYSKFSSHGFFRINYIEQ